MNNSQSIAVLGGLGFIGGHICRALVAAGYAVRAIDRHESTIDRVRDIGHLLEIRRADIARTGEVLSALGDASVLIHLVHSTVPGASMSDPSADIIDNVAATARLTSQLGSTGVRKIIYISSGGAVYGVNNSPRIVETEPTNPISSYGITKLANEKYIQMFAESNNIRCIIIRPANVYGPQQRLDKGQGIIGTLVSRAMNGEVIEIWGTGEVVRDYLFIDDMVAGILSLLDYPGQKNIFNIGSGLGHSVADILDMLRFHFGKLPEIIYKSAREFDVPSNVLDTTLLKGETGWQPSVTLDDGIARVIASFQGTGV